MRKTRSQTQAENALLSGSATNSSRSGVVTSSTTATSHHQQHQMNSSNPQKRGTQLPVSLNCIDPARFKEYEEMISLLRVVELQKILSYLNVTFAGRKVDYQRRILSFLRSNFELIAPKIREVYTQSIVEQQANQYGPTDPKRMYSQMQMQPNAAGMVGSNTASQMGAPQQILNPASQPGMQPGVPPGNNVVPFLHAIPTQMPIHPDVRLKKLAFYDVLGTLIKPSSLVPRNAQRIQEVPFYFTLTPQQATEIASNRDIRNSSKIEHAIQVQLRFCLLETSCDQEDCFPPSVSVKVNNKLCQLPNVIPTNRPNVEPKRPPRPVNVTSNVKLSPTVTNTITVQWCPDYTRGYCIAVYLVKKLTSAQLLQRMKQKGVKPADYTRALIKEKLTEDADCEIATTMLKVSLNCPLGKMKMSIPCRASTCSHLQCFDASLYLQMNERKPTWNCPVCDKPAVYDNLVIDGYFQEVLASNLLKPDDTEIQLHKDGSWSTHSLRYEGQIVDTPTKPVEKVEVISDDIELITTEDVKPVKATASASSVNTNEQPSSTTNNETVDLTLSDSDDDLPLAKRRPAVKPNTNQAQPSSTINGNSGSGGGGGGNQRGMYMQQKNDNDIISLDSPSPPASPEHSGMDLPWINQEKIPKLVKQDLSEALTTSTTVHTSFQPTSPVGPNSEVPLAPKQLTLEEVPAELRERILAQMNTKCRFVRNIDGIIYRVYCKRSGSVKITCRGAPPRRLSTESEPQTTATTEPTSITPESIPTAVPSTTPSPGTTSRPTSPVGSNASLLADLSEPLTTATTVPTSVIPQSLPSTVSPTLLIPATTFQPTSPVGPNLVDPLAATNLTLDEVPTELRERILPYINTRCRFVRNIDGVVYLVNCSRSGVVNIKCHGAPPRGSSTESVPQTTATTEPTSITPQSIPVAVPSRNPTPGTTSRPTSPVAFSATLLESPKVPSWPRKLTLDEAPTQLMEGIDMPPRKRRRFMREVEGLRYRVTCTVDGDVYIYCLGPPTQPLSAPSEPLVSETDPTSFILQNPSTVPPTLTTPDTTSRPTSPIIPLSPSTVPPTPLASFATPRLTTPVAPNMSRLAYPGLPLWPRQLTLEEAPKEIMEGVEHQPNIKRRFKRFFNGLQYRVTCSRDGSLHIFCLGPKKDNLSNTLGPLTTTTTLPTSFSPQSPLTVPPTPLTSVTTPRPTSPSAHNAIRLAYPTVPLWPRKLTLEEAPKEIMEGIEHQPNIKRRFKRFFGGLAYRVTCARDGSLHIFCLGPVKEHLSATAGPLTTTNTVPTLVSPQTPLTVPPMPLTSCTTPRPTSPLAPNASRLAYPAVPLWPRELKLEEVPTKIMEGIVPQSNIRRRLKRVFDGLRYRVTCSRDGEVHVFCLGPAKDHLSTVSEPVTTTTTVNTSFIPQSPLTVPPTLLTSGSTPRPMSPVDPNASRLAYPAVPLWPRQLTEEPPTQLMEGIEEDPNIRRHFTRVVDAATDHMSAASGALTTTTTAPTSFIPQCPLTVSPTTVTSSTSPRPTSTGPPNTSRLAYPTVSLWPREFTLEEPPTQLMEGIEQEHNIRRVVDGATDHLPTVPGLLTTTTTLQTSTVPPTPSTSGAISRLTSPIASNTSRSTSLGLPSWRRELTLEEAPAQLAEEISQHLNTKCRYIRVVDGILYRVSCTGNGGVRIFCLGIQRAM